MKSILIAFSLAATLQMNGQPKETTIPLEVTRFFSSSLAVGPTMFRDFATSPLFYKGQGLSGQIAWSKSNSTKVRKWSMRSSIASTKPVLPELENQPGRQTALFSSSDIAYTQLRQWSRLNKGKWSCSWGGVAMTTLNFRSNKALGNSAVGIEIFFNAMASCKVSRDLSHEKTGPRQVLWMKRQWHPTKRFLSFQFNVGLLNTNYRQAYDYKSFPEVDGSKLNPLNLALSSSAWAISGTRFSSELEFRRYQSTGNAVSWSYVWDVISAPNPEHLFQMSAHRIQLSLHFNRKK